MVVWEGGESAEYLSVDWRRFESDDDAVLSNARKERVIPIEPQNTNIFVTTENTENTEGSADAWGKVPDM